MAAALSTPPIETADLVVFAAAARLGSFSAAAVELQLSGASVSTRIAALERRLNTTLFQRSARGSVLTSAGLRLDTYAQRCLSLLDEAEAQLDAVGAQRLVLAAPASLAAAVFPAALRLLTDRPIRAHCRVAHSDEIVGALRDGTAHAGFLLANPPGDGLRSTRVLRSRIVAVCRSEHRTVPHRRLRFEELSRLPVVVYRWGPEADALVRLFEDQHRPSTLPVHTVGLPGAAVEMALEAGYLAVVPQFAVARVSQGASRLRRLSVPLGDRGVEIRLAYPSTRAQPEGVSLLLGELATLRGALTTPPS